MNPSRKVPSIIKHQLLINENSFSFNLDISKWTIADCQHEIYYQSFQQYERVLKITKRKQSSARKEDIDLVFKTQTKFMVGTKILHLKNIND